MSKVPQPLPEMKTFFERLEAYPSYLLILATILIVLVLLLLAFGAGKTFGAAIEKRNLEKKVKSGRNDAIKRSRAVLSGQMIEQVAPYLPHFPCNPADARFIGKPIDFIAFPGATDGSKIEEVLFIEVKTGQSALSAREKEIRDAVKNGRIKYVEYRL